LPFENIQIFWMFLYIIFRFFLLFLIIYFILLCYKFFFWFFNCCSKKLLQHYFLFIVRVTSLYIRWGNTIQYLKPKELMYTLLKATY